MNDQPQVTIVGECNPYGGDDYYVLYPAPDGCAGHRLCCLILGMERAEYLAAFHRVNLVRGKWSMKEARNSAHAVCMGAERIILLGSKVAAAFSLVFQPFLQTGLADVAKRHPKRSVLMLPHPSGLCRRWNEPGSFERARRAVAAFAPDIAGFLGKNSADNERTSA